MVARAHVAVDESYTVALPPPISIERPYGRYSLSWQRSDGTLTVTRDFTLDQHIFAASAYADVKEFFDEILAADARALATYRAYEAGPGNARPRRRLRHARPAAVADAPVGRHAVARRQASARARRAAQPRGTRRPHLRRLGTADPDGAPRHHRHPRPGGRALGRGLIPVGDGRLRYLRARTVDAENHVREVAPERFTIDARQGSLFDGTQVAVQVFRLPGVHVGSVVEYAYGVAFDRRSTT